MCVHMSVEAEVNLRCCCFSGAFHKFLNIYLILIFLSHVYVCMYVYMHASTQKGQKGVLNSVALVPDVDVKKPQYSTLNHQDISTALCSFF